MEVATETCSAPASNHGNPSFVGTHRKRWGTGGLGSPTEVGPTEIRGVGRKRNLSLGQWESPQSSFFGTHGNLSFLEAHRERWDTGVSVP